MSSFPLWLLSILQRLKAKLFHNVHGILRFFSWLLRQSRCSRGLLKSQKGPSGTQATLLPKDDSSPCSERIVLTKLEPDVFISASAVPRSAHTGSVPNLAVIPESPTARPRPFTWVARPNSVAEPSHDSLGPYSHHTPLSTRSYQDISFHSRRAREANTEDNVSTISHRLSVASNIGSTHAASGSTTRVSSRAPSRYFGAGLSQASRSPSRSRSPAPSPVHPNGPTIATPLSTPNVRPGSLASFDVNLSVVSPSESSLGLNESLPSSSLPPVSTPHSRRSSRVELGIDAVDPSTQTITVDDWSQPTASYPLLPENTRLKHLVAEETQRYDRTHVM